MSVSLFSRKIKNKLLNHEREREREREREKKREEDHKIRISRLK
jgi:hypothetical protein